MSGSDTGEEVNEICTGLAEQTNPNEFRPFTADSDCFNEPPVIMDAETQNKQISFEEYNRLVQLIPKIAKLEMDNKKLKNEINERDEIIKQHREMNIGKIFRSLTMVNIILFWYISAYSFPRFIQIYKTYSIL